jgi:hypothetical protein
VLRRAGGRSLTLVLGTGLALLSVFIERTGPERVVYSNLCGPSHSELCYKPVLKGGFPFAYLYDRPGVSVEDQLGLPEDKLEPVPFVLDAMLYGALIALGRRAVLRRRQSRSREA